ncbi:MAG: VanZ family protein [Hespellia sp.]|nr:VanZ family protein [Hespellia sp.]
MQKSKKRKIVTGIIFAIYFVLLVWLILFKFSISIQNMGHYRNINLIPFHDSLILNGRIDLSEIIYNIIVFIPLGIFWSVLKKKTAIWENILLGFCVSLAFEILQYVFAIGASDITDVIGNTFGCFIGTGLYLILAKICGEKTTLIINVLAGIGTVLVVGFLSVLLLANR